MGIEQSIFNPHDEKYKEVADLPNRKERKKYVDYKKMPWVKPEEGFITKKAAEEDLNNDIKAKDHNYFDRSPADKILFRNKLSKTDIAHGEANEINEKLKEKK